MNAEPSGSNGPLSGPLHVFLVAGASIMVLELPSGRLESRNDSRVDSRQHPLPPTPLVWLNIRLRASLGVCLAFSAPPPIP